MADLTEKQRAFAEAFLANGRNATEAYRTAYTTNARPATATTEGLRLLVHPRIAPVIAKADALAEAATKRALAQYEVTAERVTRELALLGFANMADYMRGYEDGDVTLDFSALSREQAAALTEVTVESYKEGKGEDARHVRRVKFKLADKRAALVDLGRTLKMFTDKTEMTGRDGKDFKIEIVKFGEAE